MVQGRRKPTALKILHGDFKKNPQRRNDLEPMPEVAVPENPEDLSPEAFAEWKKVTAEMESLRVLTAQDRSSIFHYAKIWQQWKEAVKDYERDGIILVNPISGVKYENPSSKLASRCSDQILKFLIQFGLTPAARTRVNMVTKPEPQRMRRVR